MGESLICEVENLIAEAARSIVLPRYRQLKSYEIEEKSPGELVTIVDREVETFLSKGLGKLTPSVPVVGEEAASAQPQIMKQYYEGSHKDFWLIDPLDGTANFAAGEEAFAVMVARVQTGETVCAWVFEPARDRLCVAERGSGAFLNGQRIRVLSTPCPGRLTGSILDRFFPANVRSVIDLNRSQVNELPGSKCAGKDYAGLAEGDHDFNMYWRLLPWDHAPGVLFLQEAGGFSGYLDGLPYEPLVRREGLIAARNKDVWSLARERLLGLRHDIN